MALRYVFTVSLLVLGLAVLPHVFGRTSDVTMCNCKGDVKVERSLTYYIQWVHFKIEFLSSGNLVIKNSKLDWGKWYDNGDKDKEIGSPNGKIFNSTYEAHVYSSGRENSPSGTEGSFEIWENKADGAQVATVYWDCPAFGKNSLKVSYTKKYVAGVEGGSDPDGPIGDVYVKIVQIAALSVA